MADFPEWLGRILLCEAVRECGLPWVSTALWRRPGTAWMGYDDRLAAIEAARRVWRAMLRRLPPGVSAASLGSSWREAAWACTVAGMRLDAERRAAVEAAAPEPEPQAAPVVPVVPVVIQRRATAVPPTTAVRQSPAFVIRRRNEVARA